MGTPHRGLPPPSAMTLPDPARGPPSMSSSLGQLPPAPSQWQGAEDGMKNWLAAKAEEERRKQEEEKTRQETLRLEQRKVEQSMLRESMQGGVPPHLVPIIFAGIGGGNLANISAEWIQQYTTQVQAAHQQAQAQAQAQLFSRSSKGPTINWTATTSSVCWSGATSNNDIASDVSPTRSASTDTNSACSTLYQCLHWWTNITALKSRTSWSWWSCRNSPTLITSVTIAQVDYQRDDCSATSCGPSRCAATAADTNTTTRAVLPFHIFSSLGTTIIVFGTKECKWKPASYAISSPKKRKAQGPHPPPPPPTSAPGSYTSPSFSHISSSSTSTPGRRGHARNRSDASTRAAEGSSGSLSRRGTVSGLAHETILRQGDIAEEARDADDKAKSKSDQTYGTSPQRDGTRGHGQQNYAPTSTSAQPETPKYATHQQWDRGYTSSPKRESGDH